MSNSVRHVHVSIYSTRLGSRMLTRRVMSQGMFPGAVVVRGADWRWGDQDGQFVSYTEPVYMVIGMAVYLTWIGV